MPSRARPGSLVPPDRSRPGSRDQDVAAVEIDATFAMAVGLSEGQRIALLLHLDPPVAHTVNIEPLTSADWEVIELHATFLELNLLSQIRALPNPSYHSDSASNNQAIHPVTLHLSPTSTATISVTSLQPEIPNNIPFAKIAPDAEVIVAPKVRSKAGRVGRGDARSTVSRRSGKSGISEKTKNPKKLTDRSALYLRGVDQSVASKWITPETGYHTNGLHIWLSKATLATEQLQGARWANVSIIRPAGLRAQLDPTQIQRLKEQEGSDAGTPTSKLVAHIHTWSSSPDDHHAMLSTQIAQMLGMDGMVGNIIRVEAATYPIQRYALKSLKVFPFAADNSVKQLGLKFGSSTRLSRQAVIEKLRSAHGGEGGLLSGPIVDGMVLPATTETHLSTPFSGGVIRLARGTEEKGHDGLQWALGSEQQYEIDVKDEIPHPLPLVTMFPTFSNGLTPPTHPLIGVEKLLKDSMSNLSLGISVLLTGSIGAGKTALINTLCDQLRRRYLANVTYFNCAKLVTDETRISAIKDTLTKLFMSAAWCARLGGSSLVVLDDLDKICPVEAELQVGNDNERSRQVTELLCSIVRQYCTFDSHVTLLATAQSKDALHNILIGGHIFGEILPIHAPDKDTRRKMLAQLTSEATSPKRVNGVNGFTSSSNDTISHDDSWMEPSNASSRPSSSSSAVDGFRMAANLDLLDVAGKTDGYMPADLTLLTSRARNEALSRILRSPDSTDPSISLSKEDYEAALKNFTPASLRNVTLTHSTTTFASVGGLKKTRNTLLETLLYPTQYAPIFASSPLRLRSGLLLYGYPGCGKTLLASAVAGECNLNFISVKGPEILNKYIGASEKSVRDLFERAQAAKPCVLFFDEFDAIAPKRGHDSTGVTDRVVNQMLTQMDGAEGLEGVYVLAATSRPDLIDPALLRPGRLDKSLLCDMPDVSDREDILRAVSEKLQLETKVKENFLKIAERTAGLTGADLQALMYNAHLEAIHDLLGAASASGKKQMTNGTKTNHKPQSSRQKNHKGKKHDFIQFLYDPENDSKVRGSSMVTSPFDSRATIAAKLEELTLLRKRERQLLRGRSDPEDKNDKEPDDEDIAEREEVIIRWKHIEKSLSSTRMSISPQENKRLALIYEEFVVGRNGEMPSGQGGTEIGGRSSLM